MNYRLHGSNLPRDFPYDSLDGQAESRKTLMIENYSLISQPILVMNDQGPRKTVMNDNMVQILIVVDVDMVDRGVGSYRSEPDFKKSLLTDQQMPCSRFAWEETLVLQ